MGGVQDESKYNDMVFLREYFTELDLSGRSIEKVDKEIKNFTNLQHLTISLNRLARVDHLPPMIEFLEASGNHVSLFRPQGAPHPGPFNHLLHLGLSCNHLQSVTDIVAYCPYLRNLDISFNQLDDLSETAEKIQQLFHLERLSTEGNPIALTHGYRETLLSSPSLKQLDNLDISDRNSQTQYEKRNYQSLQLSIQQAVRNAIDAKLRECGRRLLGPNENERSSTEEQHEKPQGKKKSQKDSKKKPSSKESQKESESKEESEGATLTPVAFSQALKEFDQLQKEITAQMEQEAFKRKAKLNGKIAVSVQIDRVEGFPTLTNILNGELTELIRENNEDDKKDKSKKKGKKDKDKNAEEPRENLVDEFLKFCCDLSSFVLSFSLPASEEMSTPHWKLWSSGGILQQESAPPSEPEGSETETKPDAEDNESKIKKICWEKHLELQPSTSFRNGVLTDGCRVYLTENCALPDFNMAVKEIYKFVTEDDLVPAAEDNSETEGGQDRLIQEIELLAQHSQRVTTLSRNQVDISNFLVPTHNAFVEAGSLLNSAADESGTETSSGRGVEFPSSLPTCFRLFVYAAFLRLKYLKNKESLGRPTSSKDSRKGSSSGKKQSSKKKEPAETSTPEDRARILEQVVEEAKGSFDSWISNGEFCNLIAGVKLRAFLRGGWPEIEET